MDLVSLLVVVTIAVVAMIVFFMFHKDLETKLFTQLGTLKAVAEAHSATLTGIDSRLASHGISLDAMHSLLDTLEDKAKNAISETEKTEAAKKVEDAVSQMAGLFASVQAIRDAFLPPAAPAAAAEPPAVAAAPNPGATTVTEAFGLPASAFKPEPALAAP